VAEIQSLNLFSSLRRNARRAISTVRLLARMKLVLTHRTDGAAIGCRIAPLKTYALLSARKRTVMLTIASLIARL
jgi:hypothetical protein